jgi:hypothetical protein
MLIKTLGLFCLITNFVMASEMKTYKFHVKTNYGKVQFEFHGNEKNKELVEGLSAVSRTHIPEIVDYFGYRPQEIVNVNIIDTQTSSNGTAQTFPRNQIRLFTMQPLGQSYLTSSVDYYKKLFLHEFIHIIHMELTDGYVATAEKVFGSIAKVIPAVVPRWFSEGIAMWGEDKFTNEGRMKNPFLLNDVANYFKNKQDCQDISCLDDPGMYPYGSLSYWAGGFFIQYLEGVKEGTVACLVKSNASEIPFFLNNSFRSCLGETAEFYFKGFLKSLKKKEYLDFLYQKGIHFTGNYPVYFKEEGRKVLLTGNDKNIDLKKTIVSIQPSLDELTLTAVDSLGRKQHYQTYSVNEEGDLEKLSEGPQYFFKSKKGDIGLKFEKNYWSIIKDGKERAKLEKFETLVNPYHYEDAIFFTTYSFNKGYRIQKFDIAKSSLKVVENFKETFHYIGLCEGEGGYYKTKNGYFNVGMNKIRYFKSRESINYIAGRSNEVLVLKDDLEQRAGTCRSVFKNSQKSHKGQYPKSTKAKIDSEDYFGPKHLMPDYWFFLISTTEDELSFWRIFTSMSDPLQRHTLMLNADYYSELETWGGNFSYIYKLKHVDLGVSYLKEFQKNTVNPNVENYDESTTLSLTNSKKWGLLETTLSAFYGVSKSKDIFSSETTNQYGVSATLFKNPRYRFEFFNNATLFAAAINNSPDGISDYKSYRSLAELNFDLYKNTIFKTRGTYEKLDKDTFSGGVLNGGGNLRSIHKFYGLDYSDALGNEISTMRLKLQAEVLRPYKGWGFVPFYLKTVDVIAGTDYLKADFILFNKVLYRGRSVTSKFVGVNIDTQIFYHIPVSIEMISSEVELEDTGSQTEFDLIISGGYNF